MIRIELVTEIRAPIERCFDLTRSIDLHLVTAKATDERAIAGVTTGLVEAGDEITWRGRHLGIYFILSSRITRLERPGFFQDRMTRGPFAFFEHDHAFEQDGPVTRLRDTIRFAAPLGWPGRLVGVLILKPHLTRFMTVRNAVLRQVAEAEDAWRKYVPGP